MHRTRIVALLLLLGILAPASAAQDQPPIPENLADEEKLFGLSLLWREAAYNFAFFDQVPDLDWDAAYRAYIPRVLATTSTVAYYETLARFVALLEDGHTSVWLPDPGRRFRSYPWILTRNVDGAVLVSNVGRTLEDRLPVNSVIVEIDGQPAAAHALATWAPVTFASTDHDRRDRAIGRALHGTPDTPVTVGYVTPDGDFRPTTTQVRWRQHGTRAVKPSLGPPGGVLKDARGTESDMAPGPVPLTCHVPSYHT